MERVWTIYRVENLWDGRSYIGMTENLEKRLKSHRTKTKHVTPPALLRAAIQEFGWSAFRVHVITECYSPLEAAMCERAQIAQHGTYFSAHGYNRTTGGECIGGHVRPEVKFGPMSEEHKKKLSVGISRKYKDPEYAAKKAADSKRFSNDLSNPKIVARNKSFAGQAKRAADSYWKDPINSEVNKRWQSETLKKLWADPDYRLMILEARKNRAKGKEV